MEYFLFQNIKISWELMKNMAQLQSASKEKN